MVCKYTRRDITDAVVSEKCFRLLYLKHEIQTDVKVLKPVVDEANVLRLCHSLGMTLSSEGDPDLMHKFEFGMFNSGDYDTEFARFIRENVLAGNFCKEHKEDDKTLLKIGCIFGKQPEVKAELARMGFWDSGSDEGLPLNDLGVFCMDGSADRRQFVVFAWLEPSLFEPDAFRDTPAYVLRFLLTLSPNITCCLSQEDFRRIKSEVDAMPASSSMRWNSCSVAFQAQKQLMQEDSITCDAAMKTVSIPNFNRVKSVWFVDGVFPSVAVESLISITTKSVNQHDVMPCGCFSDWIWEKREQYLIELKPRRLYSTEARDDLLKRFGHFPDKEMSALQAKHNDQRERAKQRIDCEMLEFASKIFDDAVRDADVLFAVRCSANTLQMDSVNERYGRFLQHCEEVAQLEKLECQSLKLLYLPERIQMNMGFLETAYRHNLSAFEEELKLIVVGDQIDADNRKRNWLLGVAPEVLNGCCHAKAISA